MELYRKHRPKTFSQVVGQNTAVKQLQNFLENDTLPHALLFTGGSGVGKTTLGRIVASELGCDPTEFNEINSADFNGVDMIRQIRQSMRFSPLRGDIKVWLLDEVHMLSKTGMEAMLKLLEDPPEYVYFMLATTEPGRLIRTIRTRCSEIALKEFTPATMTKFLTKFAAKHLPDMECPEGALKLIAEKAEGSPRKALVSLEGLAAQDPELMEAYLETLRTEETQSIELCRALIGGASWKKVATLLKEIKGDAEDVRRHVLGYARSVLLSNGKDAGKAFLVIDCFQDNFYDSKLAGLAAASYTVSNGGE